MKYRKDGVPILSTADLEQIAYDKLVKYAKGCLAQPCKTLVFQIFEKLKIEDGLEVELVDLGEREGFKVLGKTVFSKKKIFLNKEMIETGMPIHLFTAAHELGHWFLHRNLKIKREDAGLKAGELVDVENDFQKNRTKGLVTARDWLEIDFWYFKNSYRISAKRV
ncbi:MAG: hypothetical protein KAT46_06530 [Deltaproteobacteria bacterium]|nr:hypothetical protein [Deltaproteobacteria bacterium]